MKQTLFPAFSAALPGVVLKITEKQDPQADLYRYEYMLDKEYSLTGTWNAVTNKNINVAADVVALDSPLPLKQRNTVSTASGEIVKIGMEKQLNETQLTEIDTLIRLGGDLSVIIKRIFADIEACIIGVKEKTEYIFLQGLSTGVALIDDVNNVGAGIRLNYGYLPENQFLSSGAWATPATAPTLTDIQKVIDAATDANTRIRHVFMDVKTFNQIRNSVEGQKLYAREVGNFSSNLVIANKRQFMDAFRNEYEADIIIIDRNVQLEKNGAITSVKAWEAGQIIFTQDLRVGSLIWADLAEKNHPVSGVDYTIADGDILTAKFSKNDPTVAEVSRAQARRVPVIADVANIYKLDTTKVTA